MEAEAFERMKREFHVSARELVAGCPDILKHLTPTQYRKDVLGLPPYADWTEDDLEAACN